MMTSPGSMCDASSPMVWPVMSPAGTITHAARGLDSFSTNSRTGSGGPFGFERGDRVRVDLENHTPVSVGSQATDQVGSHPPESHHAELHGVICWHYRLSFGRVCRNFRGGAALWPADGARVYEAQE